MDRSLSGHSLQTGSSLRPVASKHNHVGGRQQRHPTPEKQPRHVDQVGIKTLEVHRLATERAFSSRTPSVPLDTPIAVAEELAHPAHAAACVPASAAGAWPAVH